MSSQNVIKKTFARCKGRYCSCNLFHALKPQTCHRVLFFIPQVCVAASPSQSSKGTGEGERKGGNGRAGDKTTGTTAAVVVWASPLRGQSLSRFSLNGEIRVGWLFARRAVQG